MLWAICGAGRGVGKTHLARRLCALLPDCRYAKLGTHPPRADRPPDYYTRLDELLAWLERSRSHRHLLVEAHRPELLERAELVLLLEPPPPGVRPRDDLPSLRRRADLRVAPWVGPADWEAPLARHLPEPALRRAVLAALEDQRRHLAGFQNAPPEESSP